MPVVINQFEVAPPPPQPAQAAAAPPSKQPKLDANELHRALRLQSRRALRVKAY